MGSPAIAMQGLGLGTGLVGSYLNGRAQQQGLVDKATADQQNQQLAQMQAASAAQRGAFAAGQIQLKGSMQQSAQRAAYGASGVDSQTGSAAAVQAATAGITAQDRAMAIHNAQQQAWGYSVTAQQYGEQAVQDRRAAGQVMVGTLLGDLGQGLDRGADIYKSDQGPMHNDAPPLFQGLATPPLIGGGS